MPLSKVKQAEWMRVYRLKKRRTDSPYLTAGIVRSADIRAMKRAGIDLEYVEGETGKVSSNVYYALMRDRNAIKAHLDWHHESVTNPDIGTLVEQLRAQIAVQAARITMLEANFTLHEAREAYLVEEEAKEER